MDIERTKLEYSPLNNLSSGEELEQFTLPVAVNTDRPKRRKKRKEYDSLRTQSIIHNDRSSHRCTPCMCLTAVTFVMLIAAVCGLAILVYQLYLQVDEAHRKYVLSQGTLKQYSSSMSNLLSRLEVVENFRDHNTQQMDNITSLLHSNIDTIKALKATVNAVQQTQDEESKSSATSGLGDVEQKLAEFGSDMSSLQLGIATLQQKELTVEGRLDDIDKVVSKLQESTTSSPVSPSAGKLGASQIQATIQEINGTMNTRFSMITSLLNSAVQNQSDLYQMMANATSLMQNQLHSTQLEMQQKLDDLNVTLTDAANYPKNVDPSVSDVQPAMQKVGELTNRVDQLEAYVRDVSAKLDDKITLQTENQVVNLTVSKGLEDIITRVIHDKLSTVKDSADRVALHSAGLEAKVIRLESDVQKLLPLLHPKPNSQETTGSPVTSFLNLTPKYAPSSSIVTSTTQSSPATDSVNEFHTSQSDEDLIEKVLKATQSPVEQTTFDTEG